MTDMCILMIAAVCHDLDHPGYNNTYVTDMPMHPLREQYLWQHWLWYHMQQFVSVSRMYTVGTAQRFALCNQVSD